MAFKPNSIDRIAAMDYAPHYHGESDMSNMPNSINLEIKDAEFLSSNTDGIEISIKGLEVKELDWGAVNKLLRDMGIDPADCNYLTDQFAEMAFQHLMAKALAKKIRRI